MTLLRRHPALSAEAFSTVLDGPWSEWPGGHEQYVPVVPAGTDVRPTSPTRSTSARSTAQQALASLTAEERGVADDLRMAGLGLAVGRVVARTHQVVGPGRR